MDSHERHLVRPLIFVVILIGQQGYLGQEILHTHLLRSLLSPNLAKLRDAFEQLLQVLLLADPLHRAVGHQLLQEATLLHDRHSQLISRQRLIQCTERLDQLTKGSQFLSRTGIDAHSLPYGIFQYGP